MCLVLRVSSDSISISVSQIYPLFGALAAGASVGIYYGWKTTFSPDVQCVPYYVVLNAVDAYIMKVTFSSSPVPPIARPLS